MDQRRFDDMARTLGSSAPRRAVVRSLVGGALGALLARLGGNQAAAACTKVGKKCERKGDCCTDARCEQGRCRCVKKKQQCGKVCCPKGSGCCRVGNGRQCRILSGDEDNCGRCGNQCPEGARCFNSGCVQLCAVLGQSCESIGGACGTCTVAIQDGQDVGRFCAATDEVTCATATPCANHDDCRRGDVCVVVPACGSSAVCAPACA